MSFFLRIYDYLTTHKILYWVLFVLSVVLCALAALRLEYKEDISDFLPLTTEQKQAMEVYQQISGAERIIIIFEGGTTDQKLDAIDLYANLLREANDTLADRLTTQIDMQLYLELLHWTYQHIPYFLTDDDYRRIDSIISSPQAVESALLNCKRILQMPVSGFMTQSISDDPLAIFQPVVSSLQQFQPTTGGFSSLDGYMLTDDEYLAFAIFETPYGASETKQNTALVGLLQELCLKVQHSSPDLSVRLLGAPVIAVENASRIKKDSIISVSLALLLILALLLYCFRRDLRSIPLILLTISFGWLFGMAVMGIVCAEISIIVLGIGSIIIGIAVNYPLHILFHRRYTSSVRQTLQEVLSPLIIGNITTVGAFLALIPLKAVALRDLGIFASSMLVGTILFSILFLPLLMKQSALSTLNNSPSGEEPTIKISSTRAHSTFDISSSGEHSIIKNRYLSLSLLILLTAFFCWQGRHISFDADISHINYMTPSQRADFEALTSHAGETNTTDIYIITPQTAHRALNKTLSAPHITSPYRWLPSEEEQQRRLILWDNFWQTRRQELLAEIQTQTHKQGFSNAAFIPFTNTIQTSFTPQDFSFFRPLADNILRGYWLQNDSSVTLVTKITVSNEHVSEVEQQLRQELNKQTDCITNDITTNVFDIRSLNSSLATQLSDNFDYIGIVCSLLVFVFLLISFRSWRAAVVAFLPMAISWVWIIGIMHLFGLQFNIVNIILATFIFGQGDDYTIFVVEGLIYEHTTRQRMLPQYRRSIILSALIMLVGIGVLVIARHPAMHSLGTTTLIGMTVVVLLANSIPPLLSRVFLFKEDTNDHNPTAGI